MSYARPGQSHTVLGPGTTNPHPTGGYNEIEVLGHTIRYRLGGVLHRLDGPAVEIRGARGVVTRSSWYRHGALHREDGPAMEARESSGTHTEWRFRGRLHRLDGPARTYTAGDVVTPSWWVNDEQLTEAEFTDLRAALDSGAPLEWALAFVKGESR